MCRISLSRVVSRMPNATVTQFMLTQVIQTGNEHEMQFRDDYDWNTTILLVLLSFVSNLLMITGIVRVNAACL